LADRIDKDTRSRIMSVVRRYGTRPEKRVRSALHSQGFSFRLHSKQLPRSPDVVLRKFKAVIFINGCFWHQHVNSKATHIPQTRSEFWQKKVCPQCVTRPKGHVSTQNVGLARGDYLGIRLNKKTTGRYLMTIGVMAEVGKRIS